jgi:alginate O-acetyltransferase complex protein AlgI
VTCFLVAITWVFFRAQGFDAALIYLASMFGAVAESKKVLYLNAILPALIVVAGTVLAHWRMRSTSMEAVMEKTLQ